MSGKYTSMAIFSESPDRHANEFTASYIPRFTTLEKFIADKTEMLTGDMKLILTQDEYIMLNKCQNERQVNSAVKSILNAHWE